MKLKLILTTCLLAVVTAMQAKDYKYQTVAGDLMNTRIYTLDNGLRVYLSVNKEKPRIQTFIAVRTGSKNDPAETTGLAHYLEHLMFKGTKQFGTNNPNAEAPLLDEITNRYEAYRKLTEPEARKKAYHEIDSVSQLAAKYFIPNEYDKLMAAIGAQGTNAYTSNDVTCYTEDIPSNEVENWAKIQADRFQNMVIRGFHTELEAVYEEYNIGLSSDSRKLFFAIMAMLFPDHPYGTQTTIGTQEHLKNPSIVNIKNYFNKWYVPNNCAICMSGDFDMDKTIATIDKYFGTWKPGADVRQPVFPALKPITAPRDTTVVGQEAARIWVGWRADRAASLQIDTLDLIAEVLSNGEAGLFDLNLRQPMKYASGWAAIESLRDYSLFLLSGTPKQGQSLREVRDLMLGEIEKLKKGDFSDDLLPSIMNNKKREFYESLDNNRSRADKFVDAFINEEEWADVVGKLDRQAKISKAELVAFAQRYFTNGYVSVFKEQGVDSTQKKIDKPIITPIPTNRDQMSQFVKDIQNSSVEPIQPQFVDYKKDLTITETKKKLPLLYKQNTQNGLFELVFHFDIGKYDDNRYGIAADYLNYLGTDKLTATEIKQQFYKMACSFNLSASSENLSVHLTGLSENMPKALKLLGGLIQNAKVDKEAYQNYINKVIKSRNDRKKSQQSNFYALYYYAMYGARNWMRDEMTEQQMRDTDPQVLLDLLKDLTNKEQTVLYYGPMSEKEVSTILTKEYKTPKQLQAIVKKEPYKEVTTPKDEVFLAPYDAKNIYMRMYHNENKPWSADNAAPIMLFNEYFGGGMNGIVFQELREARGLAYNAYASYSPTWPYKPTFPENYFAHVITQNDKMMDCIRQFRAIIDTIPQSETAFSIAKDAVLKQLASRRTTKMGVISSYLSAKRHGIDYDPYQKIYKGIQSLTLQDIVKFEQENMAKKPYRYIILGNEKELDVESLEKIAPIQRLSTEEIFGY